MIEEYDKDEILRLQAQLRKDNEIELRSMRNYAMKIGYEEGLKEGLKEGKAEGEKQKAIDMARVMLLDNVSVELIEKYTGLSKNEILKLKEL